MTKHIVSFKRFAIASLFLAITPAIAADVAPAAPAPSALADPGDTAFVATLKEAVAKKDTAWLIAHATFPLLWNKDAEARHVKSRGQFETRIDQIISPAVQAAVAASRDYLQNWQGIMVGDGGRNIWVRKIGAGTDMEYKIITINDDSRVPAQK
jgi:hypothetical protein